MIECALEYLIVYLNLALYGGFIGYSFLSKRHNGYKNKVKLMILCPLAILLLQAGALTYNLIRSHKNSICIYFGSRIALVTSDIGNQLIFLICSIFVFRMQSIMKRVQAKDNAEAQAIANKNKCQMIVFIIAITVYNAVTLTLKTIIYDQQAKHRDRRSNTETAFLIMFALRIVFNIYILVIFLNNIGAYLTKVRMFVSKKHVAKVYGMASYVTAIMAVNMFWYHFFLPYYYVLKLHGREPSTEES